MFVCFFLIFGMLLAGVYCLKAEGVFAGVQSVVWWLTECEG